MDQIELDLARREAGSEYLAALRTLGLRPDALFWSFDKVEGRFVMMLVTEMVDFKGPLAVADLLFQAYNASATPKGIDPFVVRLHSPEHVLIRQFEPFRDPRVRITSPTNPHGFAPDTRITGVTFGDVEFRTEWVYCFQLPTKGSSGNKRTAESTQSVEITHHCLRNRFDNFLPIPKRKSVDLSRRWRQFAHNVERLAA